MIQKNKKIAETETEVVKEEKAAAAKTAKPKTVRTKRAAKTEEAKDKTAAEESEKAPKKTRTARTSKPKAAKADSEKTEKAAKTKSTRAAKTEKAAAEDTGKKTRTRRKTAEVPQASEETAQELAAVNEEVQKAVSEAAAPQEEAVKEMEAEAAAPQEEAKVAAPQEKAVKEAEAEAAAPQEEAAKEAEAEAAEPQEEAAKEAEAEAAEPQEEAVKETEAEAAEPQEEAVKETEAEAAASQEEAAKETEVEAAAPQEEAAKEAEVETAEPEFMEEQAAPEPAADVFMTPRRSVVFIGSECYPFVKTGGLGDVMYALPKELVKQNCDVKVILPRYKCIPWEYQEKMVYRGAFEMDLCADGKSYYVGIMEYVWDGVVYDFIDNEEFFSAGNPYTNLVDDIPKYCYFAKAALSALLYMDWIPNIIHCHDWQAALVPIYLRTLFENTKLTSAKTILTIHNLRFQGVYNIPTIRYWSGLPDYVFNKDALKTGYEDANMMKGGLTYSNIITTVSGTYAGEIQTPYYGEGLDAHLRYHSGKLRGIVNGIDCDIWNTWTDPRLYVNYDITNVLERKRENKRCLQEELGLVQDDHKFVIGLISRLTNQKGLDLLNAIIPAVMDEHTQLVVLGTGDSVYEESFRYYENAYRGNVCSNIMYDETRAHRIYAGADALLVPSQFEPCGLTQLIAMHYGTVPIVRETGGLKDTVEPYNVYANTGNGFTFDNYDAGLLLDAINRAKTLFFTNRWCWDEMVQRDMDKDVSWERSARQYKDLYLELTW